MFPPRGPGGVDPPPPLPCGPLLKQTDGVVIGAQSGPFLLQVHSVGTLSHPHQLLPLHHLVQCPDSHRTDPDLE